MEQCSVVQKDAGQPLLPAEGGCCWAEFCTPAGSLSSVSFAVSTPRPPS